MKTDRENIKIKEERDEYLDIIRWYEVSAGLAFTWSYIQSDLEKLIEEEGREVNELIEMTLNPLVDSAGTLFDWQYGELWSVAVYSWDPKRCRLDPVWWKRAEGHVAIDHPRIWKEGEGHVGRTFLSEEILYSADVNSQDEGQRISMRPENVKSYDGEMYRSFASIPLTVETENGTARLGVLVITSDQPNRFNYLNVDIVEHAGEPVRHILRHTVLAERDLSEYISKKPEEDASDDQSE